MSAKTWKAERADLLDEIARLREVATKAMQVGGMRVVQCEWTMTSDSGRVVFCAPWATNEVDYTTMLAGEVSRLLAARGAQLKPDTMHSIGVEDPESTR